MIETIFVAKEKKSPVMSVEAVECIAGKGITGDRYFNKTKCAGQNITFIEAEEIESYNSSFAQIIPHGDMRRNIITRNIRLNELVGKIFSIGDVSFRGVELCEPCRFLGDLLHGEHLTKTGVVKALTHKTGLRADILSTGIIKVGMAFNS